MAVQPKIHAHPGAHSRTKALTALSSQSPPHPVLPTSLGSLSHYLISKEDSPPPPPTNYHPPCSSHSQSQVPTMTLGKWQSLLFPWQLLFFQPPAEPQHLNAVQQAPPSQCLPAHLNSLFLAQRRELTSSELLALAKHHAGPFPVLECQRCKIPPSSLTPSKCHQCFLLSDYTASPRIPLKPSSSHTAWSVFMHHPLERRADSHH